MQIKKSNLLSDILSDYKSGRISINDAMSAIDELPSQINHEETNKEEEFMDVIENPPIIMVDLEQFAELIAEKVITKLKK